MRLAGRDGGGKKGEWKEKKRSEMSYRFCADSFARNVQPYLIQDLMDFASRYTNV